MERRLDEAVPGRARHPFRGHRLADIGREGRVLDVIAGGDQVLDLVVEEVEVEHAVHVVAERQHAVVRAERPEPRLPQGIEPDVQQHAPEEEQDRVAPVRGIRPVPDGLDVQVRLEHAAEQLEDLVGDIGRPLGEHDARPERRDRRGGRAGQIAREFHQVGEHAAARRRLDAVHLVAGIARGVCGLPGGAGERRIRPPAPPRIAGDRRRRARAQPEQARRHVRLARDDQAAIGAAEPALDARDGVARQVAGVRHEERAIPGEPVVTEVGLLDDVVLEVAASQQEARRIGGQVGVFPLEPGARTPPGVGERVGLAASRRLGGVRIAAPAAPQHRDVMPSRADPFVHGLTSQIGLAPVGRAVRGPHCTERRAATREADQPRQHESGAPRAESRRRRPAAS